MSVYLTFERDARESATRKTDVWDVVATRSGELLGTIKWFGRWRQYAFFPRSQTIFNPECLDTIARKCESLTREHRRWT